MPAWWLFRRDKPPKTWIEKTIAQKTTTIHEPCRICNRSFTMSPRKRTKPTSRLFLSDCIDCRLRLRWEQEQAKERLNVRPLPGCDCAGVRLPGVLVLTNRYGSWIYCCDGSLDKAKARWLRFQEKHKLEELSDADS